MYTHVIPDEVLRMVQSAAASDYLLIRYMRLEAQLDPQDHLIKCKD